MLFNSHTFLLAFLPAMLLLYAFADHRWGRRQGILVLVLGSLFFYGWWHAPNVLLILFSIVFNFILGRRLAGPAPQAGRKNLLVLGIIVNLGLIGYFKYAHFLVDSFNWLAGTQWGLGPIVLPLAISFFTFQQIAYLMDSYRGEVRESSFLNYCLFVTFFPQLIAGPILHHKEMLGQFMNPKNPGVTSRNLAAGFTLFILGLFKKVVLADSMAPYADEVFGAAEMKAQNLSFATAWCGALAYSFQLYFDFSGYSDMALGLARMFGIRLPLNFDSPYKATNIIEFWRRWHMTLSRFMRDYLYIPLGGSRRGTVRMCLNVTLTMLLGGLWHGAGWTFVLWGGLHGLMIAANHLWQLAWQKTGVRFPGPEGLKTLAARGITFLAVTLAWVLFRAETLGGAGHLYRAMFDWQHMIPSFLWEFIPGFLQRGLIYAGISTGRDFYPYFSSGLGKALPLALGFLLLVVWAMPNSVEWMRLARPAIYTFKRRISRPWLVWSPRPAWAWLMACLFFISFKMLLNPQIFLYFQF